MLPVLRNTPAMSPMTAGPVHRLDTIFDRFFGDDGGFLGQAWAGMPVAIWHDDDRIYVEAELPGVADRDVDVTVHNDRLFIRGERKPEEGRKYLYNGRAYGRFERVITLPEAVVADGVEARLVDGLLSITLPKSPEAKPKRIPLQSS